jgi:hypothetical protein
MGIGTRFPGPIGIGTFLPGPIGIGTRFLGPPDLGSNVGFPILPFLGPPGLGSNVGFPTLPVFLRKAEPFLLGRGAGAPSTGFLDLGIDSILIQLVDLQGTFPQVQKVENQ